MLAPYRLAALPEPEPPCEADRYEARLRARGARTYVVGALIAAGLALGFAAAVARHHPSRSLDASAALRRAQLGAEAHRKIGEARAFTSREHTTFIAGVLAAIDGKVTAGTTPCSTRLDGEATRSLLVVAAGDRVLPSPSLAALARDADRAETLLRDRRPDEAVATMSTLDGQMSSWKARRDVVLVATSRRHPVRTSATTFEPGEIRGRAYVYDFAEARVVCVGDVEATSSKEIAYSFFPTSISASMAQGPRLGDSLEEDFDRQLRRALADAALVRTR